MTLMGFGGMTAFCVSSCQSATSGSDKQPKHETENVTSQEQPGADAVRMNEENDVDNPSETLKIDAYDAAFPGNNYEIPVTKYGIPSPIPEDAINHLDEMKVPPAPDPDEANSDEKAQNENLNTGSARENEDFVTPPQQMPVKRYGIRPVRR